MEILSMTVEKVVLRTAKIDCSGCSTCATDLEAENLRHALSRLRGVTKVKVDEITGKVSIEYDTKIGFSKIIERLEKLGYKVEIVSRE
jgi:copper chaperone CopZ